ncbi:putative transcriptional regulator [Kitasatospora setae KM-6054]|uniref:Putative transcriptional regulator n=1 Tax=Kitasatospora setae (strain ATCC 33774 / DSM 43861 / JCM 3304 / KCC A-0304 / NBRC 14216 / KM-6054) TaxID=452652 RepID=E4N794_KITSK|nr:putative transcriptional regulator [Kitasatospora setae KM-6054]
MARRVVDPTSSPLHAFAVQLTRSREAQGLTQVGLGREVSYSNVYISNVEGAKQAPSLKFAERVDTALQAEGTLLLLYWSWRTGSLIPGFPEYLRREREAIGVRLFDNDMVSGLLQHPEYSAAYEAAIVRRGEVTREQADERLALLAQRQLKLDSGATLHVVLDEAALRRPIGGRAVMARQLLHLEALSARPNLVLQVAPYRLAQDRSLSHPVTILTLPNRALVGYTETLQRGYMVQDADTVSTWVGRYDRLQVNSLSQLDSSAFIREARKELERDE